MNMGGWIDTAIGLAFIYLSLATCASFAVEMASLMIQQRAKGLEASIRSMISGESGDRRFVDLLMEHPIIASYKSPHFSRTGKETAPSYVPSNLFAKALLHMVLTLSLIHI